jgi:hypothetical protein
MTRCVVGYVLTDGTKFLDCNPEYEPMLVSSVLEATKFSSITLASRALKGPHTKANHGSKEVAEFSKKYVIQEVYVELGRVTNF